VFEKIELLPSPYDEEDEILFLPRWTNTSLEDCSTSIPGLNLPDEDSLIAYDGPFLTMEAPESNLDIEDDLDSSDSTYNMIKKNLVESVLDSDDDDDHDDNDDEFDDDYHNFLIINGEIIAQLVQHGDDGYVGDDEVDDIMAQHGEWFHV